MPCYGKGSPELYTNELTQWKKGTQSFFKLWRWMSGDVGTPETMNWSSHPLLRTGTKRLEYLDCRQLERERKQAELEKERFLKGSSYPETMLQREKENLAPFDKKICWPYCWSNLYVKEHFWLPEVSKRSHKDGWSHLRDTLESNVPHDAPVLKCNTLDAVSQLRRIHHWSRAQTVVAFCAEFASYQAKQMHAKRPAEHSRIIPTNVYLNTFDEHGLD